MEPKKNNQNSFTIFYYLNKGRANEQGECPIFVRFRVNGTQIAMSVKRSVLPQNWDTTGQIIGTSPNVREIRNYMICISAKLMDCYDLLIKEQKEPTAMMVRQVFEGNSEPKATSSFFDVFDQYIAKQEELVGGDVSRLTLDRYILLKNTFEQFLIHKGDDPRNFTLKNLDKSNILNFVHYLKAFKKSGHNNAMKYLQRLKKFIFHCLNHKILDEDPFVGVKMNMKSTERGYLTQEELDILMTKDFGIKRLNVVRDMFVFSCYTNLEDKKQRKANQGNGLIIRNECPLMALSA